MTFLAILLVLSSGFLHSIWNLFAKKSIDKNVFLWFCQMVAILLFVPWAVSEWELERLTAASLTVILISMILHGLYVVLLARAYTLGDLSQVYPIMRGTSPLLVPVIGVTLLNESLSFYGWGSVVLIVIGIGLLSDIRFKRGIFTSMKAPLLAFAVGLCIAGYIVVDKIALTYVSPVVLNETSNIANFLALSWAAMRSGRVSGELKVNWKSILLGGLIASGGYLLFLYALSLAPVAQLAPMREIGTVFGTLMGILILREKQGYKRITASVLITAGVICLGIWG